MNESSAYENFLNYFYVVICMCGASFDLMPMQQERTINHTLFDTLERIRGQNIVEAEESYLQLLPSDIREMLKGYLMAEYQGLFKQSFHFLSGHIDEIKLVILTPDGMWALTVSDSRGMFWDLRDPNNMRSRMLCEDTNYYENQIALSSDGSWALTAAGYRLKFWDLRSAWNEGWDHSNGCAEYELEGPTGEINSIALSSDGMRALAGSCDDTAWVWVLNLRQDIRLHTLLGHTGTIYSVALTPDGRWALTGSRDKTARLWDLRRVFYNSEADSANSISSTILQGHTGIIISVSLTPDGKWALTGSRDRTARLWDLRNPADIRSYSLLGHTKLLYSAALTPDGKWALTGSMDHTARLWDLRDTEDISSYVLQGHTESIRSVSLADDGQWALTRSRDIVHFWDLRNKSTIHSSVLSENAECTLSASSLSSDGTRVLTGSNNGVVRFWNQLPLPVFSFAEVLKKIGEEELNRRLEGR